MTQNLPSLNPIPDDIEGKLQHLLQDPSQPALEEWLFELIKSSGHLSTSDALRWRLLCIVWLAVEFDVDKAWPYLMWLNVQEPTISAHLSEILLEAVDDFNAHLQMAHWLANLKDDRLFTFFEDFYVVPAQRKMQPLLSSLFAHPTHPKVGVWLAAFCEGTRYHDRAYMRPWRLLAAAWHAAAFNPEQGLTYLQTLTNGAATLSPEDNKLLMDAAGETNSLATMIQLIAGCPNLTLKSMLQEFGHPHLASLASQTLDSPPDYRHLIASVRQARADVATFQRALACLEQAGVTSKQIAVLELACGPLATQTVLLNSAGYKTLGVDLDIPPTYLPLTGFKAWFKRNKHHQAWKSVTNAYYQALAQEAGFKLRWDKVKIKLADLTRLDLGDNSFEVAICVNHLQHAPDVDGLLSEAVRVLKPGGLFLADIRSDFKMPWGHLREPGSSHSKPGLLLNKWREGQYRQTLEKYFTVEQWLPETNPQAGSQLTPEVKAELINYDEAELTRKQIMIVARK
jgi:SAM-dependent methyltransferase